MRARRAVAVAEPALDADAAADWLRRTIRNLRVPTSDNPTACRRSRELAAELDQLRVDLAGAPASDLLTATLDVLVDNVYVARIEADRLLEG